MRRIFVRAAIDVGNIPTYYWGTDLLVDTPESDWMYRSHTPTLPVLPASGGSSLRQSLRNARLPRMLSLDSRKVACCEFGAPGGFPVLYSHQCGGSRLEAAVLDEAAFRHGIRLIAVDRAGLGASEPPLPFDRGGSDAGRVADALALEQYGLLSWGGGAAYALMQAARDPARARFCLSMSCPPLWLAGETGPGGSSRGRRVALAVVGAALYCHGRLTVRCMSPQRRLALLEGTIGEADRRVLKDPRIRRWLTMVLEEAVCQGGRGFAREMADSARQWPLDPAALDLPVEFWYGSVDRVVSDAGGQWLAARLPGTGRVHRIRGAGHFFMLRHQDLLFERLRRLSVRDTLPSTARMGGVRSIRLPVSAVA
ncbi:MAG: alpha/beta fold hydrolase [Pseudomonadota bacterium]